MENMDEEALEFIRILYESWKCRTCLLLHTGGGLEGLACGHRHCIECTEHLVTSTLRSESLYPVSCCHTPIPSNLLTGVISEDLQDEYQQKKLEYETPAAARIYCCKNSCSAFIDRSRITEKRAQCPVCETETCVDCKREAHEGYCSGDEEGDRVLGMAREQGWQQCYSCRAVVERPDGCNHITCNCGAEFCYLCGRLWRTCGCRILDGGQGMAPDQDNVGPQAGAGWGNFEMEYRLPAVLPPFPWEMVQRARLRQQARVRRMPPPPVYDEPIFFFRRHRSPIRRDLRAPSPPRTQRQGQRCQQHARWVLVSGPGLCPRCGSLEGGYLFRCVECQVQVCRTCRRQRRR
ncbi:hypothetical protein PG985_000361 [Apiospora marii]|uniref:uncharacterized protein n=1 Tax=Apiospora marii TaxID=335849 RepID=UPI0031327D17